MKPLNEPVKLMPDLVFAQITDSHLFSDKESLHYGHHVFDNLRKTLFTINNEPSIKAIIFTGDLTQDHSEQSYQNFVECVIACQVRVPIYFLAGNHDEPALMAKYFVNPPFIADKTINLKNWQIQLVDSKSETPAGYVKEQALALLKNNIDARKYQFLLMHHHPIDVGYFIDKHGLQNKTDFWQAINGFNNIKAIACGHVHGAMVLTPSLTEATSEPTNNITNNTKSSTPSVPLYTCPATSIQFDPKVDGVGALAQGPGYRVFQLYPDGGIKTQVVML